MPQSRTSDTEQVVYTVDQLVQILSSLPGSFAGTMVALMNIRDMKEEQLSGKSGISVETISRLRCCEECVSSIETLMAVCIGLNLHPLLSKNLLEKAGRQLQISRKHVVYHMVLTEFWMCSLDEVNAILEQYEIKPLKKAA